LILKDKNLFCKDCGNTFSTSMILEQRQQQQQNKLTSKFKPESEKTTIVMSKTRNNNKKKRDLDSVNRDLSEEDLNYLRSLNFAI
jgi:hypothetical protein